MPSADDVLGQSDEELSEWACSIEAGLTAWEMDFVEDMASLVEAGTPLSVGRRAKLEEIVRRKG